jgi:hypothetical protein
VTEVVLAPDDRRRFATAPAVSGSDAAAYAAFGPRQQRGTVRGRLKRAAAQGVATKQAERLSRRGRLIELDLVDADGCFARVRKGDAVTVLLPDVDAALVVRLLALSWDQDSGVLRASGEIQ